MVDDLSNTMKEIRDLKRRIRRLESTLMLQNAAISEGGLRVVSSDPGLVVQGLLTVSGLEVVDGELQITGTLTVEGPANVTGNTTIGGTLDITGSTTISGDLDTTGQLHVMGASTLEDTLTVNAPGEIVVGAITLNPSANGGSVKFTGGPEVYATGGELDLYSTSTGAFINLNGTSAKINGPGLIAVIIGSSGIQLVGLPTKNSVDANGATPGTVWSDTSGNIFRVI